VGLRVVAVDRQRAHVVVRRGLQRRFDPRPIVRAVDGVAPPVRHEILSHGDFDDDAAGDVKARVLGEKVESLLHESPCLRQELGGRVDARNEAEPPAGERLETLPLADAAAGDGQRAARHVEMKPRRFGIGVDDRVREVGMEHGGCHQIARGGGQGRDLGRRAEIKRRPDREARRRIVAAAGRVLARQGQIALDVLPAARRGEAEDEQCSGTEPDHWRLASARSQVIAPGSKPPS
jgi:hypothetical protein